MVKSTKKSSKKAKKTTLKSQRAKFGKASKKCHKKENTKEGFGKCMHKEASKGKK